MLAPQWKRARLAIALLGTWCCFVVLKRIAFNNSTHGRCLHVPVLVPGVANGLPAWLSVCCCSLVLVAVLRRLLSLACAHVACSHRHSDQRLAVPAYFGVALTFLTCNCCCPCIAGAQFMLSE